MTIKSWLYPIVVVTAGLGACKAQPPTEVPQAEAEALFVGSFLPERPFDYQQTTLNNGMRVITLEDHSTPIAAVQVWYHVGSKDEKPNRRGFAHMFEHMMFRGTQNIGPKAHFEYIRQVGGDANAYTSFDNTTYIQEVPRDQVEMVLWLEAERMAFLKINEGYFDIERNVVAEEYRLGREQPYGTAPDKILSQIFKQHPYRWTPIGDMDELAAASADELQTFWNTYYVPNNATLVVVGDIDHTKIVELAEQYFGWIPRYAEPPRVAVQEPPQTAPLEITIKERNGPAPIVALAYRTVPVGHPDEPKLTMLSSILGGGESSRLYRELITERELAIVAVSVDFSLEDDGLFGAGAVLSPMGGEPDTVLAVMREQIQRIQREGVTEQELIKAKNGLLRGLVTSQLTVGSKAQRLGDAAVIEDDLESVNRELQAIEAITPGDLQAVANQYFVPEHEIAIRIEPNLLGFIVDQFRGDKTKESPKPAPGAEEIVGEGSGKPGLVRPEFLGATPTVAPAVPPEVEINDVARTLPNGLKVVVVENHELPFVTYTMGLRFGAFADPPQMPGAASMAASMLARGTENYDYERLTDELDTYAVVLNAQVGIDTGSVTTSAVTPQAERALKLLAESVRRPTFPAEQLPKLVKEARTGLAITERSADYLADRELRRRMFVGHPYARLPDAQSNELGDLTVQGLRAWWTQYVRPDTTVLYIAGDLPPQRAFELAAEYFGDWAATGPAPTMSIPAVPARRKTTIYVVDRPAEQSQIRVGHIGIDRAHPDWFAASVLSDVFGGGFNSRLNDTIRVKKGLTYGARGGFSSSRFAGRFTVSTFSKNVTVGETVEAILEELERLHNEAPSSSETSMSKSYLLGRFAGRRETPQDIVNDLWALEYEGLGDDYDRRYLSGVATVTSEQMNAVAKRWVNRDELVVVVVGPAKNLIPQLRTLGPIVTVDPNATLSAEH